jgi:putative ABC transport system permease protein
MWLTALDKKLLRDLSRLRGQIATIAIVLASGITSFISLRGTYASLEESRAAYYDHFRFAHVFARIERAPEAVAQRIERLAGVELLQTRVSEEVLMPIEGMPRPAYARLLSLPAGRTPATNALYLKSGRFPARGRDDEVVVLGSFAETHGLEPGHHLPIVINGKLRKVRVVGVALSPEFVYAIRPGAIVDDPSRYAVLWMERSALASAFQLDGAFNDLTLRLQPGVSEARVIAAVDRILAPYGTNGTISQKDQTSNRILHGELGQLQALSSMVPLVFLGVAAFLLNLVLGRLIRLQRAELATLKAIGYTNFEVGRHYLALVVVVMVPGGALGLLGGITLGRLVLRLYGRFFRFPELAFHITGSLIASALLVSLAAAITGSLLAVRAAAKLPPAEAMRPPAPARYRRSILERLGLSALAGPGGMMVLREVFRRPGRTALSAVGIAGAVGLLILARFGWDSISSYFETTFRREQRQDLNVTFLRPIAPRATGELARARGVLVAEGLRAVPIRIHYGHRMRSSVLMGLDPESTLRRLVGRGGREVPTPSAGVLATRKLGEVLGFQVGDRLEVEILEGDRPRVHPVVSGFVDEATGLQLYARADEIAELEHDQGAISSVLLSVDPKATEAVEARLRRSPRVIDVSDVVSDMRRMREMNASFIDVWTAVSIVLAASVILGVVYNNARISLAARSRELASLRVLGFSRREISLVLLGGLAIDVGLAIPIGLVLGRAWAEQFMRGSMDQETFRWAVVVSPRTYLMAASVALLAAAASAFWVRRSLDRLDLIGVLKTRE